MLFFRSNPPISEHFVSRFALGWRENGGVDYHSPAYLTPIPVVQLHYVDGLRTDHQSGAGRNA